MQEAFVRTAMLLGEDAMEVLAQKHVAVFGLGGVGSFCAEALARAGVGALTLVDDDTVAESNLNRQLVALRSTLGRPKAEVMAARIQGINPQCRLRVLAKRYTPETREEFFDQPLHYIADCIDSVGCKVDLIATALERGIPILSAMGTGNKLDPGKLTFTDLAKTSVCPLARVMRRELKKRGVVHHQVLYSTEEPIRCPGATVPGSVAWVPSCAGLMMAGKIVLSLTKA
mgnify:CR=1 FL=1